MASLVSGAVLASAFGAANIADWILYRQRLGFSVFDLGSNVALRPFDHATHDGLRLRSWYVPAASGRPVIIYFAGRDGDLLRKPGHLMRLTERGYGLLLAGYRGYGGNPGRPSEFDFYLDAIGMLAQFDEAGEAAGGYVIYGYSMGTGVAANTAAQTAPLGVILEAPLSNFLQAVRQQVRGVPAWLVRTRFDNLSRVSEIDAPLLLLAGGMDMVTPSVFALALAEANPAFARVEIIDDANHLNIIRLGGGRVVDTFLASLDATDAKEAGREPAPGADAGSTRLALSPAPRPTPLRRRRPRLPGRH